MDARAHNISVKNKIDKQQIGAVHLDNALDPLV